MGSSDEFGTQVFIPDLEAGPGILPLPPHLVPARVGQWEAGVNPGVVVGCGERGPVAVVSSIHLIPH